MNIDVIYKLVCKKCEQVYIDQTQFEVNNRMNQHKHGLRGEGTSAAVDHVLYNKGHTIEFDKIEMLSRDNTKKGKEMKECLLTLNHSNSYNTISHEPVIFK